MRCPNCGARNTSSAAWCTQCFASLRAADPPDEVLADPPDEAPAAPPPPAPAGGAPPPPPPPGETGTPEPVGTSERDIRLRGEVVEWRCVACDAWSPLEASACTVCAAPRHGFGSETSTATSATVRADPTSALVASVLLPGLGHLLRGRVGTGLARAVLWLLWGGGGLAVLLGSGGGTAAAVLLLAALAVWAVTLVDLQRLETDHPPLATAPVLAWSVVAVTLVLAVVALAAAVGAGSPTAGGSLSGAGPATASLSR